VQFFHGSMEDFQISTLDVDVTEEHEHVVPPP
jgi:hypothetical protein